jgi:hypothetical protein
MGPRVADVSLLRIDASTPNTAILSVLLFINFRAIIMLRFVIGDELGNIKSLCYTQNTSKEAQCELTTIHQQAGTASGASSVQQLVTLHNEDQKTIVCIWQPLLLVVTERGIFQVKLGAAFSDGSSVVSTLSNDDKLEVVAEWKEPRLTSGRFIGSALRAT